MAIPALITRLDKGEIIMEGVKKGLVSVVIPVYYPTLKHFSKSLESILNQTYKNFEVLLISDGLTEEVKKYISSFNDSRIKLFENPIRIGFQKSLNLGLSLSKGEFIARVDSDDICLPNRLEQQKNFLDSNSEYALVGSNTIMIDDSDNIIGQRNYPQTYEEILKQILKYNPFAHSAVFFKKSEALKLGGYNESLKYVEDYDLWIRLAEQNKCFNLNEPLVMIRNREQSIRTSDMKKLMNARVRIKRNALQRKSLPKTNGVTLSIILDYVAMAVPSKMTLWAFNLLIMSGYFKNRTNRLI